MIRAVLAVLLAAVVMFVWGFVFWVLSPLPFAMYSALPNESVVVETLRAQALPAGHYHYPWADEAAFKADPKKAEEAWVEKHRKGPLFTLVYQPEGKEPMGPAGMGMGFGHMASSAAVAGLLLWLVGGALPGFVARWAFVGLLGLFASVAVHLGNPIWFHHTWTAAGVMSVFDTVGWVLAGLPLAGLMPVRKA